MPDPVVLQVLYYQTVDERRPIEECLGDWKSVGGGVGELRIDYGPGYRVYFGRDGMTVVVLLCGGYKGTQSRDIGKARKYWRDYEKRKRVGGGPA